jgi:hypothetical protein
MEMSNEATLFIHRGTIKQTTNVVCFNCLLAGTELRLTRIAVWRKSFVYVKLIRVENR